MSFCINAKELRAALAEIEAAERNGFKHCLAVFEMVSVGDYITQNLAGYSDLLERAHPTDGNLNWGRFQRISQRFRFKNGKLVAIKSKKARAAKRAVRKYVRDLEARVKAGL